jgi:hypothetical protein
MMDGPGSKAAERLGPKVVGGSGVLLAVGPIFRGRGRRSGVHKKHPAQTGMHWWECAPPVEMEIHHELIIIIIQCLWGPVGSPSKREHFEDDVGAHLGLAQLDYFSLVLPVPAPKRAPTSRPEVAVNPGT